MDFGVVPDCKEPAKSDYDKIIAECLICCVKGHGRFCPQSHRSSASCVDKMKNEEKQFELNH